MRTLGFVGTAKNTGKTTTALHILQLVSARHYHTALTSIGYDGENNDHVTGLPKPRYFAEPGMLVATAQRCLDYGTAEYGRLQPTGLRTILGEVMIAEVQRAGYVHVAGPNRRVDIERLLQMLRSMGVEVAMLDGALNRLAPMVLADGMVLSTGAAFDERIPVIAEHAAAMESLFHYPKAHLDERFSPNQVGYAPVNGDPCLQLPTSSILDAETAGMVLNWFQSSGPGTCLVPGVCDPGLFLHLAQALGARAEGCRFVFTSPVNLIASGSPPTWRAAFAQWTLAGGAVAYTTPTPLCFLTVNPFYPQYLQKTGKYIPAFVDKTELLAAARQVVSNAAVIDILQPPHPDLLALCGLHR